MRSPCLLHKALALAAAAVLSACAAQPATRTGPASTQKLADAQPASCLRETGSRLLPQEGRCLNGPGRVLLREDLDRTGEISISEAVRKLIP